MHTYVCASVYVSCLADLGIVSSLTIFISNVNAIIVVIIICSCGIYYYIFLEQILFSLLQLVTLFELI